MVTNIRTCDNADRLTAYTNGGAQHYTQVADLLMLPLDVHFNNLFNLMVQVVPGAYVHGRMSSNLL